MTSQAFSKLLKIAFTGYPVESTLYQRPQVAAATERIARRFAPSHLQRLLRYLLLLDS